MSLVLPTLYQPIADRTIPQMLVRHLDAASARAIGAFAAGLEPRARLGVAPLSANLDRLLVESRTVAALAGALGALALTLAAVGLFSVFAYVVQQRTHEIGIRMALGARPAQVLRGVLGSASRALAAGLAAGLLAAIAASRLIAGFLFGMSPLDPVSYAAVGALLATAGLAASYLPARRAARVDPMIALRHE